MPTPDAIPPVPPTPPAPPTAPAVPPPSAVPPPPAEQGDATGGVIPYKNPPALIAYYLGVFSIIPIIGFLLGIAALILGIVGLKRRKRHPVIRGAIHAWIGIVVGSISILVHLLLVLVPLVVALRHGR